MQKMRLTRGDCAALGDWGRLGPGEGLGGGAAGKGGQLLRQGFQRSQGLTEGLLRPQALVPLGRHILALRHHVLEQILPACKTPDSL